MHGRTLRLRKKRGGPGSLSARHTDGAITLLSYYYLRSSEAQNQYWGVARVLSVVRVYSHLCTHRRGLHPQ